MRYLAALPLVLLAVAAGCGGSGSPTPESIVREWSVALNAGNNERAADLFAKGAQVVQGPDVIFLENHADAVRFNSALPCSGTIVNVSTQDDTATATFLLGDRKTSQCDAPGQKARAAIKVEKGKIVLWHQLPSPRTTPATPV